MSLSIFEKLYLQLEPSGGFSLWPMLDGIRDCNSYITSSWGVGSYENGTVLRAHDGVHATHDAGEDDPYNVDAAHRLFGGVGLALACVIDGFEADDRVQGLSIVVRPEAVSGGSITLNQAERSSLRESLIRSTPDKWIVLSYQASDGSILGKRFGMRASDREFPAMSEFLGPVFCRILGSLRDDVRVTVQSTVLIPDSGSTAQSIDALAREIAALRKKVQRCSVASLASVGASAAELLMGG